MDKQQGNISLLYRQEVILQNETIARLNEVSSAYMQQYRRYANLYPSDDARPWTFQKIAQILAYYRLSLCYSFGILSRTDNMSLILEPGKMVTVSPERATSIIREYEQYLTFSFFHVVFSSFESSMRSIVEIVPVNNRKGRICRKTDKFSDIFFGLINGSKLDPAYLDLFELLLMVRNCIHNRSIYFSDKGSRRMVYKGRVYDFVQGRPIEFATIVFLFELLLDIEAFFVALYDAEPLTRHSYIRDHVLYSREVE